MIVGGITKAVAGQYTNDDFVTSAKVRQDVHYEVVLVRIVCDIPDKINKKFEKLESYTMDRVRPDYFTLVYKNVKEKCH